MQKSIWAALLLCCCLWASACNQKEKATGEGLINNPASGTGQATGKAAKAVFLEEEYDFGTVQAGEYVRHQFKFVNKGQGPLVIQNANASCGCTIPDFSRDPIAPGDSGVIKVMFNSEGRSGEQNKVITVTTNADPGQYELTLRGTVQAAPDQGPLAN